MRPPTRPDPPARRSRRAWPGGLTLVAAATLALATLLRLPAAWESGNALNHVSGAWLALADDLARGTLYRPLHDPSLGFGGTRFFPLPFTLHAALARAGVPLVAGGYALSLAATVLLALAAALLVRRAGAPRPAALACGALALAGFAGQLALSAARGDALAVALSAAGLAALLPAPSRRGVAAATALFALAFAAKPTALTAPAAAVLWLALRREGRLAAALGLGTGALAAGVVLATDALSAGRFLALLGASAAGGGDLRHALAAPARLARELAVADPAGLVLVAGGLAAAARALPALAGRARAGAAPPAALAVLWLAAAGAGATVVFASPGTAVNHLLELEAASAVVLGAVAAGPGRAAALARVSAPAAAAAGIALALTIWRADVRGSRLAEVEAVARALPPGPILSEDPLVPLAAGQRPAVLDAWMLRLAAARDPALHDALARSIDRAEFAAVVLFQDLDAPGAEAWLAERELGLPCLAELRRTYRRAGAVGRYHLYLRRAPGEREGAAGVVPRTAAR